MNCGVSLFKIKKPRSSDSQSRFLGEVNQGALNEEEYDGQKKRILK